MASYHVCFVLLRFASQVMVSENSNVETDERRVSAHSGERSLHPLPEVNVSLTCHLLKPTLTPGGKNNAPKWSDIYRLRYFFEQGWGVARASTFMRHRESTGAVGGWRLQCPWIVSSCERVRYSHCPAHFSLLVPAA